LVVGRAPGVPWEPLSQLVGQPAPPFEATDLDGEPLAVPGTAAATELLLFFSDSGCSACDATYPALRAASEANPVLLIGAGDRQDLRLKVEEQAIQARVVYDSTYTLGALYQVVGLPAAVLLDSSGTVRAAASGLPRVSELLATMRTRNMVK